jgi:hypothetical protein
MAELLPFGKVAEFLGELLPSSAKAAVSTVRNRTMKVGKRLEKSADAVGESGKFGAPPARSRRKHFGDRSHRWRCRPACDPSPSRTTGRARAGLVPRQHEVSESETACQRHKRRPRRNHFSRSPRSRPQGRVGRCISALAPRFSPICIPNPIRCFSATAPHFCMLSEPSL